jgi:hypothetical protein
MLTLKSQKGRFSHSPALLLAVFLAATTLWGAGCKKRVAQFSVVSTQQVDLYPLDLRAASPREDIKGIDGRWWFFFVPLGGKPRMEEALKDACSQGGGDLLTDAALYERFWTVGIISRGQIIVEGKVWNSRQARRNYASGSSRGGGAQYPRARRLPSAADQPPPPSTDSRDWFPDRPGSGRRDR